MTSEEHLHWLRSIPQEDYEMTGEKKASIARGEEDMKAGRVVPWAQVEKELDL
jgi:predicted transcriptional regulator